MPTIARDGPYRFFFYSNEAGEPPHVHVRRDTRLAKFWLRPVRMASSVGFRSHELRRLEHLVTDQVESFLEAWDEHFQPSE